MSTSDEGDEVSWKSEINLEEVSKPYPEIGDSERFDRAPKKVFI